MAYVTDANGNTYWVDSLPPPVNPGSGSLPPPYGTPVDPNAQARGWQIADNKLRKQQGKVIYEQGLANAQRDADNAWNNLDISDKMTRDMALVQEINQNKASNSAWGGMLAENAYVGNAIGNRGMTPGSAWNTMNDAFITQDMLGDLDIATGLFIGQGDIQNKMQEALNASQNSRNDIAANLESNENYLNQEWSSLTSTTSTHDNDQFEKPPVSRSYDDNVFPALEQPINPQILDNETFIRTGARGVGNANVNQSAAKEHNEVQHGDYRRAKAVWT